MSGPELEELQAEVQRLRAELASLHNERLMTLELFEHAPVAVEVYDSTGTAMWLNQAQVDFLGLPSADLAVGKFNCLSDPQIEAQGFKPLYERAYAGEIVTMPEMQLDLGAFNSRWRSSARKPWFEGLIIPLEHADGTISGVATFVREITTAKQIEQALLSAQRHESLGMLAGGIAHDFNNLLTAIMGNASVAQLHDLSPEEVAEHLDQIIKTSEAAALLTRQLLAYAGKGKFRQTEIELRAFSREMMNILRVVVPNKISVRIDAEGEHWIKADEVQIQQLLMNLVTNASEAIGDTTGTIAVQISTIDADREHLAIAYGAEQLAPGRYVSLEVSDSGCGMDVETQARLFDPFFTTKERGHGLGLAAILGIVKGHMGAIRVYSEPARGTTFKVLLPVSTKSAVESAPASSVARVAPGRGRRILVADDESFIGLFAQTVLRREGHEVVVVVDGGAAVDAYRDAAEPFDLVVLDMSMPVMTGPETHRELRRINPKVRVLLTSGYNEQESMAGFAGRTTVGFLQKPYRAADLVRAITGLLDA